MKMSTRIAKVQRQLDALENGVADGNKLLAKLEDAYGRVLHLVGSLYVRHTDKVKADIDTAKQFLESHGRGEKK